LLAGVYFAGKQAVNASLPIWQTEVCTPNIRKRLTKIASLSSLYFRIAARGDSKIAYGMYAFGSG
jgi:hypothetical protein